MLKKIKQKIRNFIPESFLILYHKMLAFLGTIFFGIPSSKMIIVGVTGTKGKTTTSNFIWSVLQNSGTKTGLITSANIKIGDEDYLNDFHMTMPGRFYLQKKLAEMYKKGCEVAVVETSSEGLKLGRDLGVFYDVAVFTNLSPEHLPSHNNSFEVYKKTKGKMFQKLNSKIRKIFKPKQKTLLLANKDDNNFKYFFDFVADEKKSFSIKSQSYLQAKILNLDFDGVDFMINNQKMRINLPGEFNVYNILPAILIARWMNIEEEKIASGVSELNYIPGRMEKIENNLGIKIFVDYAHDGRSIESLLRSSKKMIDGKNKIIILLGAEGGGRDPRKRFEMGRLSAKLSDYLIISNVDPYEEDPQKIADDIKLEATKNGMKEGKNVFIVLDRTEGIKKSIQLAQRGDIVLITGKGAEQSMDINGKVVKWDDRVVVREVLESIG